MFTYKNKRYSNLSKIIRQIKKDNINKKYYIYLTKEDKYFVISPKEV
ncbi:MAG: hypothetical protein N4A57_07930 [Anaeromicrobium sp.]|jgi:hypothetical protein|nr:hypothetical protein [Anaeromicrobium sp.]MCT4594179.1 hypothetical protein [Anaeromicrobium sp.]